PMSLASATVSGSESSVTSGLTATTGATVAACRATGVQVVPGQSEARAATKAAPQTTPTAATIDQRRAVLERGRPGRAAGRSGAAGRATGALFRSSAIVESR